jgi:hypothetical protein
MEIEELKSRLDALEAENNKLKADNLELSGEVQIWKPSARVEVAQPADRRTAADFAKPKLNIRQFRLEEANAMDEGALLRAIQNHVSEQLQHLGDAPKGLVENMKVLYPVGLLKALKGKHIHARKEGYRGFGHCLILQQFGFVPFVGDAELRQSIF